MLFIICVCVHVCLRVNVQDKISDGTHTKGDMILSTPNVVELVTKLHTVIQEVYRRMLPVHIKDRWEGEGREGKEGGEGSEGGRRGEGRRKEKRGGKKEKYFFILQLLSLSSHPPRSVEVNFAKEQVQVRFRVSPDAGAMPDCRRKGAVMEFLV